MTVTSIDEGLTLKRLEFFKLLAIFYHLLFYYIFVALYEWQDVTTPFRILCIYGGEELGRWGGMFIHVLFHTVFCLLPKNVLKIGSLVQK